MAKTTEKKTTSRSEARRAKIQTEAAQQENSVKEFPTFENAKVVRVLKENDVNGFHKCEMSDGTQKHVPVSLF